MNKTGTARMAATVAALVVAWIASGCAEEPSKRTAGGPAVVPAPLRLESRPSAFVLGPSTRILVPENLAEIMPVASYLKDLLAAF